MLNNNDALGFILSTVARKVNQYFNLRFQAFAITSEQWAVLNKLAEQDGIAQRELSERTEKDPNNITKILDQLERKGWIQRVANPEDRRSFLLYITKAGQALIKEIAPLDEELLSELCTALSSEQVAMLRKLLLVVNETINEHLN